MSILFPYRPETPLVETLKFFTDILPHKDGTEQRVALRAAPRQEYLASLMVEDGLERQRIENMLFDSLDETFDLPIWPDVTYLSSVGAIAATSISCDTTLSDFRSGGKALIYQDESNYEVVTITAVASGSLTISPGLVNLWPATTEVYPLRSSVMTDQIRSRRYSPGHTIYSLPWRVVDNSVNIGGGTLPFSTLGFGTDADKLVIDDPNAMSDTLAEGMTRNITVVDAGTGTISTFTNWDRSRRSSTKTWITTSRAQLWGVRKVLHYLQGPQTSFFLPSYATDLIAKEDISSASTTLAVAHAGLSLYTALGRLPRKYIRVLKTDGTKLDAAVTGTTVVDATTEQITISAAWGANVLKENISRIMILEKVRIDGDDIQIQHANLLGTAQIVLPVKAVLE